ACLSGLQCIISGFACTYLHDTAYLVAEDFSVPNLTGKCGFLYCFNGLFLPLFRGDYDFKLDLRMHEDFYFGSADYFFKTSLGAETHDLRDSDAIDFYFV